MEPGDLIAAPNYTHPALFSLAVEIGAQFPGFHTGPLVTSGDVVETGAAKVALAASTGAAVVDMETSEIHRLCVDGHVRVLSVRAISDGAKDDLPVPARVWFDPEAQRPRPFPLVLHLLVHPGRIVPFARFVRGVNHAGSRLTAFMTLLIQAFPEESAGAGAPP